MIPARVLVFALLTNWLASAAIGAEAPSDPYRSSVPVSAQTPAELKRAAGVALSEVVVRVAGQDSAATHPGLREAIANAERYVDEYHYETSAEGGLVLSLQFAPAAIQNLLRTAGLTAASAATGSGPALQLRVLGIEKFADYAALVRYLDGVQAQLEAVDADAVVFALKGGTSRAGLAQRFAADRRLVPEPGAPAETLVYRWQPLIDPQPPAQPAP